MDDPNEIFFLFSVADINKARAFITAPSAVEAGKELGVIDGDYWFVE